MAWSEEHKVQTRRKILDSAGHLFTSRGYANVSIDAVMQRAGLTRGAFYAHFSSKSELYAQSIVAGASKHGKRMCTKQGSTIKLQDIAQNYLSMDHRNGEDSQCPLAFLITDIAQQDEQVRDTYTRVFKRFIALLEANNDEKQGEADRVRNLQNAVMMIGGLAVARAVSDDELAGEVLLASQSAVLKGY